MSGVSPRSLTALTDAPCSSARRTPAASPSATAWNKDRVSVGGGGALPAGARSGIAGASSDDDQPQSQDDRLTGMLRISRRRGG